LSRRIRSTVDSDTGDSHSGPLTSILALTSTAPLRDTLDLAQSREGRKEGNDEGL